jgi:uncharacterized protein (DUF1684 family)
MRCVVAVLFTAVSLGAADYRADVQKWREEREARLKAPDGWLSLAGLFWLQPGNNPVGSHPDSRVKLSAPTPARVGVLSLEGDKVTFRAANNGRIRNLKVNSDDDFVQVGDAKLFIIHRGQRYGVRIKDNAASSRTRFTRLEWYPVDPSWRVTAKYTPYPQARKTFFDSQSGDKQEMIIPGMVEFVREGRTVKLSPVLEDDQLFFVFRDKTAGKSTYPAARFLYAKLPTKAGPVELDFNKAYNPPCVFTPYATCPLPPRENRLDIEIAAGEKMYAGPQAHEQSRLSTRNPTTAGASTRQRLK